jgi:hypothetical protein
MTLPEIEKVTKILAKVKQLDTEIIAIENMARTLSENIYDVDFSLSFTPVVKNEKVEVLDSDGFLKKDDSCESEDPFSAIQRSMREILSNTYMKGGKVTVTNGSKKLSISYKVNESLALKLLAVILRDKQSVRDNLMVELRLIGVSL